MKMKITSLKNEHGVRVYHVIDDGCIHEFATYKTAQNFRLYCGEVTNQQIEYVHKPMSKDELAKVKQIKPRYMRHTNETQTN
jgi:hypothetical protein